MASVPTPNQVTMLTPADIDWSRIAPADRATIEALIARNEVSANPQNKKQLVPKETVERATGVPLAGKYDNAAGGGLRYNKTTTGEWFIPYVQARAKSPTGRDFATTGLAPKTVVGPNGQVQYVPWTKDEITDYYYQSIAPSIDKLLGPDIANSANAGRIYDAINGEVNDRLAEQAALQEKYGPGTQQSVLDLQNAPFDFSQFKPTNIDARRALPGKISLAVGMAILGNALGTAASGLGAADTAAAGTTTGTTAGTGTGTGTAVGTGTGAGTGTATGVGGSLLDPLTEIIVSTTPYTGGGVGAGIGTGVGAGTGIVAGGGLGGGATSPPATTTTTPNAPIENIDVVTTPYQPPPTVDPGVGGALIGGGGTAIDNFRGPPNPGENSVPGELQGPPSDLANPTPTWWERLLNAGSIAGNVGSVLSPLIGAVSGGGGAGIGGGVGGGLNQGSGYAPTIFGTQNPSLAALIQQQVALNTPYRRPING